jgi:hypothetical protein
MDKEDLMERIGYVVVTAILVLFYVVMMMFSY